MRDKFCYCYKVENIADEKSVLAEISKLEGVKNCQIIDGVLFYEITEWCNEYDILVASMEICANYGGELIVGEDNQVESEALDEENLEVELEESQFQTDYSETSDEDSSSAEKKDKKFELVADEDETLNEKRVKLKKDVLTRVIELSLSLVLFIVAGLIPVKSDSVFTVNSILLILAFAVSVYEIFYFTFIAISKKRLYDSTITVMIACIAMVLFGSLQFATIISIIYSVILSISQYSKRHREIMLSELYDVTLQDEEKSLVKANEVLESLEKEFAKGEKVRKTLGYCSLLLAIFSFFTLIPQLKLTAYATLIVGISVILAIVSDDVVKEGVINARVFAKYCEIEYGTIEDINQIAKSNALEIDASVMLDNGELKENTIGAMKEFVALGMKSLKTNFDVEPKEEIRDQVDFVDKEFKGKKTLTIGNGEKMLSFEDDATHTQIKSGDMASLPLAYKIAKRCSKVKGLAKFLSHVSALFIVLMGLLPVFNRIGFALHVVSGAVLMVAISALINLINFKTK